MAKKIIIPIKEAPRCSDCSIFQFCSFKIKKIKKCSIKYDLKKEVYYYIPNKNVIEWKN